MTDLRKVTLDRLLNDTSYDIEFNGHLSNHNKHAIIALYGLGCTSTEIKDFYENYAHCTPYGFGLESPRSSVHQINANNWKKYLGKRTSFWSYYDFFEGEIKADGIEATLQKYIPELITGWVGGLTHALIHLGWGLDVMNKCMIAEGIAYLAYTNVSCHSQKIYDGDSGFNSCETIIDSVKLIAKYWENNHGFLTPWVESIVSLNYQAEGAKFHGELSRSGLQYRIAKMLTVGHPVIYAKPAWLDLHSPENLWAQMECFVTLLYLAEPADFLVLHFITSLYAMKTLSQHMPTSFERRCILEFWVGLQCILFSRGYYILPDKINTLNVLYANMYDREAEQTNLEESWDAIIERAKLEAEEHNPKLVYVLKKFWKASGRKSIFRIAASCFTETPELPKTFQKPPIYEDIINKEELK